jgi:hypothetical protein
MIARTRIAILAYGFLSAAFYSSLLPLWEGFDELYHYGYVQHVSTTRAFPRIGQVSLSRELWVSLDSVAVSQYIQPHLYRPSTSFQEYFHLSAGERQARRRNLELIPPAFQNEPSRRDNYEVKQAPLTYLLLAPFDRMLAGAPLPYRVLTLRLLLCLGTAGLLWIGARGLASRMGLSGAMEAAALFSIFSCQMLYGAIAHVANDALMLPWLVFFLNLVIDSCESPTLRRAALLGLLGAIGALIKASLLIFLPLVFAAPALLLIRRRGAHSAKLAATSAGILLALAGPWYARNLVLSGNLTATIETSGVGPRQLLSAASALPWRESIATMAHSALWTCNNSFTAFSALTLNFVLALLAISGVLYFVHFRRTSSEIVTLLAIAIYCAGLVLITLSFFYSSHGAVTAVPPWYMQELLAPVVLLCFLGLSRFARWGRWIATINVLLWGYVATATWIAKLVPQYGGFEAPHARPGQLLTWYLENSSQRNSILANLSPAPLALLHVLFVALLCALFICWARVLIALLRPPAA